MKLYCGKCREERGQRVELLRVRHRPVALLPKREKRDHGRCPAVVLYCTFCQVERHPGQDYEGLRQNGHGDFIVRRFPHVIGVEQQPKAA